MSDAPTPAAINAAAGPGSAPPAQTPQQPAAPPESSRPPVPHQPPLARATKIVLVAVLGTGWAIALGLLFWAALYHANPAVRGTVVGYEVTSDRSVVVRYEIVRKAGVTAQCVIRARAADGSEVGRRLIVIPDGPDLRIARTEVLATTSRAITGEIQECRAAPGR